MPKHLPSWHPSIRLAPDGRWEALLSVVSEPVDTREDAEGLVRFVLGHMDKRLPDVALQLDAATEPHRAAPPLRLTA